MADAGHCGKDVDEAIFFHNGGNYGMNRNTQATRRTLDTLMNGLKGKQNSPLNRTISYGYLLCLILSIAYFLLLPHSHTVVACFTTHYTFSITISSQFVWVGKFAVSKMRDVFPSIRPL